MGTNKDRLQHERVKHGIRAPMRKFAFADGKCRACETQFSCRWRLLQHLSDSRRTKCKELLEASNVTPLSAEATAALDEADRESRRRARADGHTQIQSTAPATRNGREVGRFCQEPSGAKLNMDYD